MGQECQCMDQILDLEEEEANEIDLSPIKREDSRVLEEEITFDKSFSMTDEVAPSRRKRASIKKYNVTFVEDDSIAKQSPERTLITTA